MGQQKVCTKCNECKPLIDYHKANDKPMGVKSACKECQKPIKQRHYQINKEKYRKAYSEFIERNPNYRHDYYLIKNSNL